MDFINQILATVKTSQNPEMYYLAVAILLIIIFYVINKIIRIAMFFLIIGVLGLGFGLVQSGGDVSGMFTSLTTSMSSMFSGTQQSPNLFMPKPAAVNPSSSSSLGQLMSGMLSKFSGGK